MLGCAGPEGDDPDPWPGLEAQADDPKPAPAPDPDVDLDPDLREAIETEMKIQDRIEANRRNKRGKQPGSKAGDKPSTPKKAKASDCGEQLSFSTLSVSDVSPEPLLLPDGGWRARIKWSNAGSRYVDIDPISRAVFTDEQGGSLDVATLPGSRDWFMGFSIPPGGTKTVTVTFHNDGGPKPFVEKIRYDYVCG